MKNVIAFGPERRQVYLLFALGSLLVACGGGGDDGDSGMGPDQRVCERDESEDPSTTLSLIEGEAEQFICPRGDQDWYEVAVTDPESLVRIQLEVTATRTPIQATYALWSQEGGELNTTVAAPPPARIGRPLDAIHCVPPGGYLLEVRDRNDDGQDIRHPYRLSVETQVDPDTHEPNASADAATPLSAGDRVTGAISCMGDEDWYSIDVPRDTVLRVRLTSPITDYRPHVRIFSAEGDIITEDSNVSASLEATNIDIYRVLPSAGSYRIVISDTELERADPLVPYELLVDVVEDLDPNEPNNHPNDSTDIVSASRVCGDTWSDWMEVAGTIGSPGDVDWFALPVMGCAGGLVEAELRIATGGLSADAAWRRQQSVQASLSLVRSHPPSACDMDDTCRSLSQPCTNSYQCEGYFDACGGDGLCAGIRVCLPSGLCAANQIQRNYTRIRIPDTITIPPPPNRANISAPIPPDDIIYFRVSDFQSDGGDPNAAYSLRVRVRLEPDEHEPNNVYRNRLTSIDVSRNAERARPIPVHDCTVDPPSDGGVSGSRDGGGSMDGGAGGSTDGGGSPPPSGPIDCCDETTWVTGSIGYEDDTDWFRFNHPCSGQDCMMRVHYQVDEGDTEHYIAVFQGTTGWAEASPSSGVSGSIGGLDEADRCFYAFREHSNPYYIMVRDDARDQRDHDPDVRYRVCVERIARTCEPPCFDYPDGGGCGPPM